MDTSVPKEDLWDDLKSNCEVVSFKRITIKKKRCTIYYIVYTIPTKMIELKFPKLNSHISTYNMICTVMFSVRCVVQCNTYLRYGYTRSSVEVLYDVAIAVRIRAECKERRRTEVFVLEVLVGGHQITD